MGTAETAAPAASVADSTARKAVRSAPEASTLDRRLAFESAHPGVRITPPWENALGLWEARWAGGNAGYDTCAGLLGRLEAEFGQADDHADAPAADCD
jgi:hypothetical protein